MEFLVELRYITIRVWTIFIIDIGYTTQQAMEVKKTTLITLVREIVTFSIDIILFLHYHLISQLNEVYNI